MIGLLSPSSGVETSSPDGWALAASGASEVPLDVVLSNAASEFSDLYRLADVCAVREVRVSMAAAPGFLKAVKLAASLRLPVRVLPGQPTPEVLAELTEALEFYLHGPMVGDASRILSLVACDGVWR